jgi:hypothetical protein
VIFVVTAVRASGLTDSVYVSTVPSFDKLHFNVSLHLRKVKGKVVPELN